MIWRVLKMAIVLGLVLAAAVVWYTLQPARLRTPVLDVSIERGSSMREAAHAVASQGVEISPVFLTWLARASGHAHRIQAGDYRLTGGSITPWQLLQTLTAGSTAYAEIAIIDGWTFARLRQTLNSNPDLRHDTLALPDAEVARMLGLEPHMLEAAFMPDTYFFARGSSDVEVLRRARARMNEVLQTEWAARAPGLSVNTPAEALILASIVEKETGAESDRARIASVFHNRLRIGMPLQSDPTVIYGMGERFDGNLRRNDLQMDTPHNTYTRGGLPPTPIALTGAAALRATLQPEKTDFLYFVARGDGSSVFSRTLDEHNRAVARYQKSMRRVATQ